MLPENKIPRQAPTIEVGIVLPEDNTETIRLTLPDAPIYSLISEQGKKVRLASRGSLSVRREGSHAVAILPTGDSATGASLELRPEHGEAIAPRSGVQVHEVVAGRNFHWKKSIEVFLPGVIGLRVAEGKLILINHLPFEQYLMCVATSEMGAACPSALIESQTIAARSWVLANVEKKHRHLGMDVCNDDCCQRYQGTGFLTPHAIAGARNTTGQVMIYDDKICDARYSKSCGGMMEAFETIWAGEPHPYLQVKPDTPEGAFVQKQSLASEEGFVRWLEAPPAAFCSPAVVPENELVKYLGSVDEEGRYYRWQYRFSQQEMTATLNKTLSLQAARILALLPGERGGSGRLQRLTVLFEDRNGTRRQHEIHRDYAIRAALHERFLYSSAIAITTKPADAAVPAEFIINGCGWGHGVGYCQIGALGMALKGYSTEEILHHYFPGTALEKIY